MNLISDFLETAQREGNRTAIVDGAGRLVSFDGLARRSGVLANYWRNAGIQAGDRVLVAMPVGLDLYAAIAGLWRIGATIVFPEPAMGLAGVRHAVRIAKPKACLTTGIYRCLRFLIPDLWRISMHLHMGEGVNRIDPVCDVSLDHPALISFTSGSTGQPKGIIRSHGFLSAQNRCVGQLIAPSQKLETDLVAFPVFVIANLGQGVTSVLPNWRLSRHDKARAQDIARHCETHSVTRALVPPSICETVAEGPIRPQLDTIFTGGGPVFPDLSERLKNALPTTSLITVYGSTEAEPIAHLNAEEISEDQWQAMKTGSGLLAGKPVPEVDLKIIEEEILVTGDHVNKGYLDGRGDSENKVSINGRIWHKTGDAGRIDAQGQLWLRGRHTAKAGTFYPFELEAAARFWPGVTNVALVPKTDPPVLAVEGIEAQAAGWRKKAREIDDIRIMPLRSIPLDRRHRSKVDYTELGKLAKTEVG
ncbi:MAG: AMP-binding protein [Stappiaceae bacterium]